MTNIIALIDTTDR